MLLHHHIKLSLNFYLSECAQFGNKFTARIELTQHTLLITVDHSLIHIMNQNELLRIQKSYVCLGNDLDLNGDFLNILQEEKVLTFNHIDKIKVIS